MNRYIPTFNWIKRQIINIFITYKQIQQWNIAHYEVYIGIILCFIGQGLMLDILRPHSVDQNTVYSIWYISLLYEHSTCSCHARPHMHHKSLLKQLVPVNVSKSLVKVQNISQVKSLWGPISCAALEKKWQAHCKGIKHPPHQSVPSSYPQCSNTPPRHQSQTVLRFTPERNAAQRNRPYRLVQSQWSLRKTTASCSRPTASAAFCEDKTHVLQSPTVCWH